MRQEVRGAASLAEVLRRSLQEAAQRGGRVVEIGTGRPKESELVATVRAELELLGQMGTPVGQQAMVVASRLVPTSVDTGSSFAALSRELSPLMTRRDRPAFRSPTHSTSCASAVNAGA